MFKTGMFIATLIVVTPLASESFAVTPGERLDRIEDRMAAAVRKALREEEGSILAFLPGAREIRRTAELLEGLPPEVHIAPLFGAMAPAEQDAAVAPSKTASSS